MHKYNSISELRDAIVELYKHHTLAEVGDLVGLTAASVSAHLQARGVSRRPQNNKPPKPTFQS